MNKGQMPKTHVSEPIKFGNDTLRLTWVVYGKRFLKKLQEYESKSKGGQIFIIDKPFNV